ncbi:M56 family metallopeptidase [Segatella baroniae]|uniref:M56 family metallopeptidase n=1 Tax=Segatella baroniae TaxID=305719 RepID=UPI001EE35E5B|nr:M56 family metallopeptidase [Segatella baroniae]
MDRDTPATATLAESYAVNVLPALEVYAQGPTMTVFDALGYVYWLGVGLLSLRMAWQLMGIVALARKTRVRRMGSMRVHCLDGCEGPFSFFRWIFVNPDRHTAVQLNEILTHEHAHVAQWHSVDTMVAEWFSIFCWFNPFAWLLKHEVRVNLEFLADDKVLADGNARKAYQYHLLGLAYHPNHWDVANNFNVLPLKKRIKMMNKRRTKQIGVAKYLLFAPLAAALLIVSNIESVARTVGRNVPMARSLSDKAEQLLQTEIANPSPAAATLEDMTATAVDEAARPVKKLTVSGTVRDTKGRPVVGATVVLRGSKRGTVTDKEGRYRLSEVPVGSAVEVKYVGTGTVLFTVKGVRRDVTLGVARTADKQQAAYDIVDQMPNFPGGKEAMMKYISGKVKYPITKASGRVVVQFIVDTNGAVVEPKVVRSVSPKLDQAALDAVKGMPKWEPGKLNGKPVRVKYNIPINFEQYNATGVTISQVKGNTSSVFFVDGKRVDNVDALNPDDIESITVQKDEATMKQYDSGGKPVVLVKLKKK